MTTTKRPKVVSAFEAAEEIAAAAEAAEAAPEPEPDRDPDEPTAAEIVQALKRGVDSPEVDPEVMAAALVSHIMDAEAQGDVLTPITPTTAFQVAERPLQITGYQLRKSYYLDGPGVYLLLDAVDLSNGEVLLIMCGAVNVVAQVLRAAETGALEVPVRFEQRTSQAHSDRTLLWLRPYDQSPAQ